MSNRIDVIVTESPIIDPDQAMLANLTELIDGTYTWTIGAQGGFKTASVDLRLPATQAFQMLNDYIGKRLYFYSPTAPQNGICWEGMISTITVDDGKAPISRSMANVYNHVRVLYSTVDYSQSTPVLGQQRITASAIDGESEQLYGWRMLVYSAGGMSDTDAVFLREALYNKYRRPRTLATGLESGGAVGIGEAKVTLDVTGYWETLDKYIVTDTMAYVPQPLDTLVQDIIDPSIAPSLLFMNPSTIGLVPNSITHSPYQDKYMTVQQYLNSLCGYGHAGYYGPSFFGMYENRIPYYTPYPVTQKYTMYRTDPSQTIRDSATGEIVPPWLVRPANIITIPDLLPATIEYADDVEDVRSFVIGEVQFTAPNIVRLAPATDDPTQVILSRLGLGGL